MYGLSAALSSFAHTFNQNRTLSQMLNERTLIFITEAFPYGRGEAFIENEFPFLLDAFDEIIIVPTTKETNLPMREHGKAKIVPLSAVTSNRNIFSLIYAFFFYVFSAEFYQLIAFSFSSPGSIKSLFYWIPRFVSYKARAHQLTKVLSGQLTQEGEIVIYSYWLYYHAFLAVNLFAGDSRVSRRISRAHSFDIWETSSQWNILHSYLLNHLDAVYPCSCKGEEFLKKQFPLFEEKIGVAFLGTKAIDIEKHKQIKEGTFRLVSCSRIDWVKRIERIIYALAQVASNGGIFELNGLISGTGT